MQDNNFPKLDRNGDEAPVDLLGRKFAHGNGKVYEVIGFAWGGDTDEWCVLHSHVGIPVCSRTNRNFRGNSDLGVPRFVEVK